MIEALRNRRTIYVDVDGTLLFWPQPSPGVKQPGTEPIINNKLVAVLREWKTLDKYNCLVIWSANGIDHVNYACELAKITDIVDFKLHKPEILIDDNFRWIEQRFKIKIVGYE